MKSKRPLIIVIVSLIILLIPFIAMQFTEEVVWTLKDFIIAGVLLIGMGLLTDYFLRIIKDRKYKIAIIIISILLLLIIWVELAVGIFGSPFAGS